MGDRLRTGLAASRAEIEAGLAEARSELERARARQRELEDLITLGTATLLAAEMIGGTPQPSAPRPTVTVPESAPADSIVHEKSKAELTERLARSK